ncbi:MAG: ABC transporter substrate-binding protein [Thiobacillaceae bacterium]
MSEPRPVRVGYILLTGCAPVVMASLKGHDRRHGIRIELTRAPSWAAIRDGLITGALDAAHALYGLVYGVEMGIGIPPQAIWRC